ncbi:MAG: LacI family DNA-binding transcriptional regulator [Tabrizicola sp.]|nr:LacI family DNA-binding transcriptional regulator [Tabrizicola sp.]
MSVLASKKRSNLRDVAKAAGVSVATVSRVLNAPALVSEDTRNRVRSVIDTLHFVPSAAARAINSGRTRMVGALVPTLDNAIFARFLSSLEEGLGNYGLSLVVATTDGDDATEATKAERLVDIGVEALIVSGVTHSAEFDDLVRRTRLPAIATSYFDKDYHLPTVGYDNAGAAALALHHLTSIGHRDIAVFHGPADRNDRTRARLHGLKEAANDANLHYFLADITMEGGMKAAQTYLRSGQKCTAVLCLSDVLAMSALFEFRRNGIDVPGELSIMGVDDLPASAHTEPRLTSVRLPVDNMGREAANAVAEWIERQIVPKSLLLRSSLVIRESTRRILPA